MFDRLNEGDSKDRAKLAKDYFSFRMKDPDKYALFDRLEHKLTNKTSCPDLVSKLHEIRASNLDKLAGVIKAKIDDGNTPAPSLFSARADTNMLERALA